MFSTAGIFFLPIGRQMTPCSLKCTGNSAIRFQLAKKAYIRNQMDAWFLFINTGFGLWDFMGACECPPKGHTFEKGNLLADVKNFY